jgi:hypothetical protein
MVRFAFKNCSALLLSLFAALPAQSQIRDITFGDIPKEDLEMAEYAPDPSADAVILENYASTGMRSGDEILTVTDCHIRIKIINTGGLDYANVELPYWSGDKLTSLKAASYNLEDGTVVQNLVDKKSYYRDNTSRYRNILRFSVPNVRPGTVIEYKYTLESPDYFSLYTFKFQEEIPVRRCLYRVEFPGYFEYKFVTGGDFKNIVYRSEQGRVLFGDSFMEGFIGTWRGSNIPAYREEPFSTGSDDYFSHIGFELSKINIPGYYFQEVSPTYQKYSEKLLDRDDFGGYIKKGSVVKKKAEELKAPGGSETDLLRRIYSYVSGYMMWDGSHDFTASAAMPKVYSQARGNSADINLMLLAMLRMAGIESDPVILSTRENGLINPFFAINSKFNHVVVAAVADGKSWIIDATDPVRPFSMLPAECLNGRGWVVNRYGGSWVDIDNGEHYGEDVRLEMNLDENGRLTGNATAVYESYDACQIRKFCSLQGEDAYRDFVQDAKPKWKISGLGLQNLDDPEKPVIEKTTMTIPYASEINSTFMYLNPVVDGRTESNEFYAGERLSVIDLTCPAARKYSCSIRIPDGWTVAELPQSVNLRLDGGGGVFTYHISAEGGTIKLDSEISFSTVTFLPERYETIRNFWSAIISKQAEVVILKKEI